MVLPTYAIGDNVATRKAFGETLAALGVSPQVVVIDAEVGNSTYTEEFGKAYPDRFFQMFIAEEQMIGTAVGFSVRSWVPFAATLAAFMMRAYDFIRMAARSLNDPMGRRGIGTQAAVGRPDQRRSGDRPGVLALAALGPIWGYGWVVRKVALGYSAPFTFTALYVPLSAGCLLLALVLTRRSLRPPPPARSRS